MSLSRQVGFRNSGAPPAAARREWVGRRSFITSTAPRDGTHEKARKARVNACAAIGDVRTRKSQLNRRNQATIAPRRSGVRVPLAPSREKPCMRGASVVFGIRRNPRWSRSISGTSA
jgi:hypothetical protein